MRLLPVLISALVLAIGARPAVAIFIPGERVPTSRVVAKLESRRDADPKDPNAYYSLARVYYLAAVQGAGYFEVFEEPDRFSITLPRVMARDRDGKVNWREPEQSQDPLAPDPATPPVGPPREPRKTSRAQFVHCATLAVHNFEEAIAREPENALYWLGYACVLEEIWKRAFGEDPASFPPEFRKVRVPSLRDAYAKAFAFGKAADAKVKWISPDGHVTLEAAKALERLETAFVLSAADEQMLAEARATIARFASMRIGATAVTPIVFTLQRNVSRLDELLAPHTAVRFDLRGHGPRELWSWVKPALGFLVWDPDRTGRVASARQLFGGYTFQLFWKNGYDALSVLDDNDDGELTAVELDGISAWFDLNSNGISDPGEVTPLQKLDIIAISTRAVGFDGIHPTAESGLTLKGGTKLRTWDWMVAPIERADLRTMVAR